MTEIVVRNVPKKIGTYTIKDMCRSHGAVQKVQKNGDVITVSMPNKGEALMALARMRGTELGGHRINVSIK